MLRKKLVWVLLASVVIGVSLIPCTAARAGLLAYWDMNAGTGTAVADQSGNSRDATLIGGAGWTTGKSGLAGDYAASLSGAYYSAGPPVTYGATQWVETNAALPALGTGDFTVSGWSKGGAGATDWRPFFNDGESTNALIISPQGAPVRLRVSVGSWFTDVIPSPTTVFDDTSWYNIAVTRSGTTVTAYVNGAQEGSTGTSSATIDSHVVKLGILGGALGFNGAIDDVAVWNQALTAGQISALYSGAATPLTIPEPSTLALLATGLLGLLCYAWRKRK